MPTPSVLVLGGGVSGMAAAYGLAKAGWREITIAERQSEVGGLAGTFQRGKHSYPLAYHHILHRDRTLLYFLDVIGALHRVRWRRIRLLFHLNGRFYNLTNPADFLRFPMGLADKARFVRLMLRSFRKSDWGDWHGRSAADLVDIWAGPGVRRAIFEPLTRLKFDLPCEAVSGAWLGARLHFREGSAPLGYIPGCNWTKALCDGLAQLLEKEGVRFRLRSTVTRFHGEGGRVVGVDLDDGDHLRADVLVSTLPTEVYVALASDRSTPRLDSIRYTAVVSAVCGTRQEIRPNFYWLNLASLDRSACGIFILTSLNPTLGAPGETCVNFVTHVASREHGFLQKSDNDLMTGYLEDFRAVFGHDLRPAWSHLTRLSMYSPVFHTDFENPPVRSQTWRNVYLAGNYRTFPSVATTGTALQSGLEAAQAILADHGQTSAVRAAVEGFRLTSMPRP